MSSCLDAMAKFGKKHQNTCVREQHRLGVIIQRWQKFPGGPDKAPEKIRKAGIRARNRLVDTNLMLVVSFVNRRKHMLKLTTGVTEDDLLQACLLGFMRACEKHDPTKGYRMSTIAHWWQMQAFNRFITLHRSILKVPSATVLKRDAIAKGRQKLEDQTPHFQESFAALENSFRTCSLDQPTELGTPLGEAIPGKHEAKISEPVNLPLDSHELELLEMRYQRRQTVREIAEKTGIDDKELRRTYADLRERLQPLAV